MLAATSLTSTGREYHVYLSYAHVDEQGRERVQKIVDQLRAAFEAQSGEPLRIFVDRLQLRMGAMWEPQLFHAMRSSCVMLAMLSSAYFKSEMCGKEWDYFLALEQGRAAAALQNQGLIFGVKLGDWRAHLTSHQERRRQDAGLRHYYDVGSGAAAEGDAVKKLATDLVDVLSHLPVTEIAEKHEAYVFAKIGADQDAFVKRLAEANYTTIVGITHQHLADYLERALTLKRTQDPNAFWADIKVVFLHESMLTAVRDELSRELAQEHTTHARRLLLAQRGARAVQRFFFRSDRPNAWSVLRYDGLLPFVGTRFEDAQGEQGVQIAMLRPGYPTGDYLFLQFTSRTSPIEVNYYSDTFSEIVRTSTRFDEIIVTGTPPRNDDNGAFRLQNAVARRSALLPGSHPGTVPLVLLLLWQETGDGPVPLLQIRTVENRARELETLSNVSCYILQQDCPQLRLGDPDGAELDEVVIRNAIARELREELGIPEQRIGTPTRRAALRLIQSKHPNVYALVYSLQLDADGVDERVRLGLHSFQSLLDLRLYQVLAKIQHVLGLPDSPPRNRSLEALGKNLVLHSQPDLAADLARYFSAAQTIRRRFEKKVGQLQLPLRQSFEFHGEDHIIRGLPRLQYREFFGSFLQAYARIGIAGAQECLDRITTDAAAAGARDELAAYYRSAIRMAEDPAEIHP